MLGLAPINLSAWVADHRRHHAHTDRCGDPHSPSVDASCQRLTGWRGLWHAQLGWLFDGSFTDPKVYASDIVDDRVKLLEERLAAELDDRSADIRKTLSGASPG